MVSLTEWNSRLADHFSELANRRLGDQLGVFALEHGLSDEGVEALSNVIRSVAAAGTIADEDWLPWVVYATESGYQYSGDEYWQSFEEKTPRWATDGDREWIRRCFSRFQRQYSGVKPAGAWAEHFTIICWPITHAILPRDLQRHLARVLYEVRHVYNSALLQAPEALGELIQTRSLDASSRFRHLAQHTRLIGQIATALLRPEDDESQSRILPGTLLRIGQDLERERRARHWLGRARASAAARLQLKGLTRPASGELGPITRDGLPREFVEELGMEPRLLLRPGEDDEWHVFLEFPDLSHLRDRFPGMSEVLSDSRCFVAGSIGSPVPRGGFLYGPRRVRLARWPESHEALLQFEAPSAETVWMQSVESLLRPGPRWLTRVSADGLAREMRSQVCRPGGSYIVCSVSPLGELPYGRPIELTCAGVEAVRLDLPDVLGSTVARSLTQVGLATARRLEVWPAGIPAASWDDEGYGEWITSQPVCIGMRADHDVHRLELERVAPPGEMVTVEPESGEPLFLELASHWSGVQRIRVTAYSSEHGVPEAGELVVRVRDPREWSPYKNSGAALRIEKQPSIPSMEQIWEGDAVVLVHGPPELRVRLTFSLLDSRGKSIVDRRLGQSVLPIDTAGWSEVVGAFRRERKAQQVYDVARALNVEIDAGLLGREQLVLERETSPLRWLVESRRGSFGVQLMDDTGRPEEVRVSWSAFARPAVQQEVSREQVLAGVEVDQEGGLFFASGGSVSRGVVVPPSGRMKGFQALVVNPTIDLPARSVTGMLSLIRLAARWSGARLPGDLASAIRREQVLKNVLQCIFSLIGGERWQEGETRFQGERSEAALEALADLVGRRSTERRFARALLGDVCEMARASTPERVDMFCEITRRTLAVPPGSPRAGKERADRSEGEGALRSADALVEWSLRLASLAQGLKGWSGAHGDAVAEWLLENPAIARGARLIVLGVDMHSAPTGVGLGRPHGGWEWS